MLIMRNIYFSERRWLSKTLNRLCDLQSAIEPFTGSKGKFVPEHREKCFLDLAFLVDLTTHLNELNMRLQGENQIVCIGFAKPRPRILLVICFCYPLFYVLLN